MASDNGLVPQNQGIHDYNAIPNTNTSHGCNQVLVLGGMATTVMLFSLHNSRVASSLLIDAASKNKAAGIPSVCLGNDLINQMELTFWSHTTTFSCGIQITMFISIRDMYMNVIGLCCWWLRCLYRHCLIWYYNYLVLLEHLFQLIVQLLLSVNTSLLLYSANFCR